MHDTVIIGSGFGGSLVAHELVRAGERVLLVERGGWVARGEGSWDDVFGFFQLTPAYTMETSYRVEQEGRVEEQGICACVGGPSVYYGGASFRFREADFDPAPEIHGGSGAGWPVRYAEMERHYGRAEALLGVAGSSGEDPTEPPRSSPYPSAAAPLAPASRRIAAAARELGLHPSRIPLAIRHGGEGAGECVFCTTCDGFACRVGAKRDLATAVIPELVRMGMELRTGTVATRLVAEGGRVTAVECVERATGRRTRLEGRRFVLAAGALASPHLLLASGLERHNPAGAVVGRYLMRHCNAFVYGVFPRRPNPEGVHHKQLAILDFYRGDPGAADAPPGKLGSLQQVMAPLPGAPLRGIGGGRAAALAARLAAVALRVPLGHMTGLLAIAEDQPREENRVEIDASATDAFGLPRARVVHRYTERDRRAREALVRRAREILRAAGAAFTLRVNVGTFSHAVGTVRMGEDPRTSPLDPECRFRGLENLRVVDGSFMPSSAGVNPSLTIAANALRVGERMGSVEC